MRKKLTRAQIVALFRRVVSCPTGLKDPPAVFGMLTPLLRVLVLRMMRAEGPVPKREPGR